MKFNGWEPSAPDDGKNQTGTHLLATLPYNFEGYVESDLDTSSSMQLAAEAKFKQIFETAFPGLIVVEGHLGTTLPETGDYILISADLPFSETEGFPTFNVKFQVMTDVAIESSREAQVLVHANRVGTVIDMFNWENFDQMSESLNS